MLLMIGSTWLYASAHDILLLSTSGTEVISGRDESVLKAVTEQVLATGNFHNTPCFTVTLC